MIFLIGLICFLGGAVAGYILGCVKTSEKFIQHMQESLKKIYSNATDDDIGFGYMQGVRVFSQEMLHYLKS